MSGALAVVALGFSVAVVVAAAVRAVRATIQEARR